MALARVTALTFPMAPTELDVHRAFDTVSWYCFAACASLAIAIGFLGGNRENNFVSIWNIAGPWAPTDKNVRYIGN